MSSRSLNRIQLIGNLTRDPELRYTPNNKAVISFTIATSRRWTTNGDKREETEFHRIVAWDRLAEICSQLLVKGSKVYVEGRLHYRTWTTPENVRRDIAEIVITDMILLAGGKPFEQNQVGQAPSQASAQVPTPQAGNSQPAQQDDLDVIELPDDDLPFDSQDELKEPVKPQTEKAETKGKIKEEKEDEAK